MAFEKSKQCTFLEWNKHKGWVLESSSLRFESKLTTNYIDGQVTQPLGALFSYLKSGGNSAIYGKL